MTNLFIISYKSVKEGVHLECEPHPSTSISTQQPFYTAFKISQMSSKGERRPEMWNLYSGTSSLKGKRGRAYGLRT
jgi:hypothetical protein